MTDDRFENDDLGFEEGEPSDHETARSALSNQPDDKPPKFRLPLWLKITIMSALVFMIAIAYLKPFHEHNDNAANIQGEPSDVPTPDKRKPVPDILMTAGAGSNKKLSDFKGHVVLLSFWASWCTPCLVELPTFIELHEKLASKGLVILPLNVDEASTAASFVGDFWKTKKFPFPTFYDPTHQASEKFEVDALPSNYVLDKQGRLVARGYGANDWSSEASARFIEQLLGEKYP